MAEGGAAQCAPGMHCGQALLAGRLEAALDGRGSRLTAPRKALLEAVAARTAAAPATAVFTPAELLAHCQQAQPGMVSRATVYRTLELLAEAGLIAPCDGGQAAPEPAPAAQQCYRLAPEASAEVRLMDDGGRQRLVAANPELLRVLRSLCKRNGFTPGTFAVEIRGEFK
jgi:Fe2+ or Zn2+ uptake regulation protein